MSYYDNEEEYNKRGFDYDLVACLEYNGQPFDIEEVEKVLAVFEGEKDEYDWSWILKLNKKASKKYKAKFVYLQGGCDYTGWDCRSSAESHFCKTALQAAELAKTTRYGNDTFKSGVYTKLIDQLKNSKNKTWREDKEEEFKNNLPKI